MRPSDLTITVYSQSSGAYYISLVLVNAGNRDAMLLSLKFVTHPHNSEGWWHDIPAGTPTEPLILKPREIKLIAAAIPVDSMKTLSTVRAYDFGLDVQTITSAGKWHRREFPIGAIWTGRSTAFADQHGIDFVLSTDAVEILRGGQVPFAKF